mgnify:CR=1 FL=1
MTDFDKIREEIATDIDNLNNYLKKSTTTDIDLINTLSSHMIDSGGKRIRPIILILLSRSIKNNDIDVLLAAAIIELIHAATLLHDDVVDQSDLRHNIKTANKLWGNDSAVLVGDFLYSRAFELIVKINNENIYKELAETTNMISQGEIKQLMVKDKLLDNEDDYFEIIYLKTAKLFEASAAVASHLKDESNVNLFRDYGKNFGIAYQLRNDYLDYFGDQDKTGKNLAEDLIEGKSTLPLIHSLGCSNNTDKSEISRIFNGKIKDDAYILLEILKKNKSDEYTENKITEYSNRAIYALRRMNSSKETKLLEDLTKYCSFRFK